MLNEDDWSLERQFPPHVLREYALLADGEREALVGPRGDIAWMCVPRWHSDAAFSTLIGGGGCYAVSPADPRYVWGGYYEDGSLIWRSRWVTTEGIIECREALAYPGDARTAVLLRRVEAKDTPALVRVQLDVRAGFGRHEMTLLEHYASWTGRAGPLYLRWSGGQAAAVRPDGRLELELTVAPGGRHDLVLELSDRPLQAEPVAADVAWEATEAAWARELRCLPRNSTSARAACPPVPPRAGRGPAPGGLHPGRGGADRVPAAGLRSGRD